MKVCWCEQSGVVEDRSALISALSSLHIDFFRYNWRHDDDPFATVVYPSGLSWSMGRSLLFTQASTYDYYIFSDDDVVFVNNIEDSLRQACEVLDEYAPLTATFGGENWHSKLTGRIPRWARRDVHPFFLADLQCQILSHAVASKTFPAIFDGGWGTLWYPNIAIALTDVRRQLMLSHVEVSNTRRSADGYYGGEADRDLRPRLIDATINDEVPGILRAAIRRHGMQPVAQKLNLLLAFLPPMSSGGTRISDNERWCEYMRSVRRNTEVG